MNSISLRCFVRSLSYISRSARVCITFSPTWLLLRRGLSPHRLQHRRAKSRQSWSRVSRAKIETSRSTTTRWKLFINEIVTLHKLEIICEVGNQMRAIFSRESRVQVKSLEKEQPGDESSWREPQRDVFQLFLFHWANWFHGRMENCRRARDWRAASQNSEKKTRKLQNHFSSSPLPHNQKALCFHLIPHQKGEISFFQFDIDRGCRRDEWIWYVNIRKLLNKVDYNTKNMRMRKKVLNSRLVTFSLYSSLRLCIKWSSELGRDDDHQTTAISGPFSHMITLCLPARKASTMRK